MGNIVYNGINYTKKPYTPKKPALVSWSTGTDDEIVAMVNGYYDGALTIDEIKSVWSLGDCRSVDLLAMDPVYNGGSHRAQTVQMMIIDFEHDDLTTAIGDKTKALITLFQKDCLMDAGCAAGTKYQERDTEMDTINIAANNENGWDLCIMRTWCNDVYYNSIPNSIKQIIKTVKKIANFGGGNLNLRTSNDKCFLPAEVELTNTNRYSFTGEGYQYSWFSDNTTNKIRKLPIHRTKIQGATYWLRSPTRSSMYYAEVINTGIEYGYPPSGKSGIAPAFCL